MRAYGPYREIRDGDLEVTNYNHFDDFCKFLSEQKWMSESLRRELTVRLQAAMSDAFSRGRMQVADQHQLVRSVPNKIEDFKNTNPGVKAALDSLKDYANIDQLKKNKREVAAIRSVKRRLGRVEAIKVTREQSAAGLKEAVEFVDSL